MWPRSYRDSQPSRDVERADVDAELERVGRDDRAHRSLAQPLLDFPPAMRQIAAAIAANPLSFAGLAFEIILQICGQDLGRQPALREDDQLQVALQKLGRNAPRFAEVRAADARADGSRPAG